MSAVIACAVGCHGCSTATTSSSHADLLQGPPALQHLELRGTCVSAQPLWGLTRLRSLALDASTLYTPFADHMDLLASLRGLTRLQVLHALCDATAAAGVVLT
jgi:hypothetical protein